MKLQSSQPLIIAHHLVFTAYGHWLPNDPRGSGSTYIQSDLLKDIGEIHYGRKKIQPVGREIETFHQTAEPLLRFPVLNFGPVEMNLVADAFNLAITHNKYTCYACAIMPDHVHVLIRKHRDKAEDMIRHLQNSSRTALGAAAIGGEGHPIWTGGGGWKVFLDHPDDIWRTIKYIENNPIKQGLPAQSWYFVQPYDGWPLHPGHNPNSPWARRMRKS